MKQLPNTRGFHNSNDGVIPTLLSIIEQQNGEIEQLKRDVYYLKNSTNYDAMKEQVRNMVRELLARED